MYVKLQVSLSPRLPLSLSFVAALWASRRRGLEKAKWA